MGHRGEVLVAILNNRSDFVTARDRGWYRIPVSSVQKWLKNRKGRSLNFDDLLHYQKVVVALKETIRLMAEIDALIPGWPIT